MKKTFIIAGALTLFSIVNINAQSVIAGIDIIGVGAGAANVSATDPNLAVFKNALDSQNTAQIFRSGSVAIGDQKKENPKVILDLSDTSKGFLPTRLTTDQITAINAGASEAGMVVYDTNKKCLSIFDGTKWSCTGSGGANETGSYSNPGSSCRAILGTNPNAVDGEYWLTSAGKKFKTLCNMTDGGYTLIWSYSENTALKTYGSGANMVVSNLGLYVNKPYSFPNDIGEIASTINYENFRLSNDAAKGVRTDTGSSYYSTYKVRVTTTPASVPNDAVAEKFNLTTYNSTSKVDFLDADFATKTGIMSKGTYAGYPVLQPGTGPTDNTFGGISKAYLVWYNSGGYSIHIDFPNSQLYPAFATKSANLFGWYGEDRTDGLEWGKCSGATFAGFNGLKYCPYTTANAVNNPVRYTQWWVK